MKWKAITGVLTERAALLCLILYFPYLRSDRMSCVETTIFACLFARFVDLFMNFENSCLDTFRTKAYKFHSE